MSAENLWNCYFDYVQHINFQFYVDAYFNIEYEEKWKQYRPETISTLKLIIEAKAFDNDSARRHV